MKYAVETKVYDSGKVELSEVKIVANSCKSASQSNEKYDFYLDVFNSKKEALEFIQENKES